MEIVRTEPRDVAPVIPLPVRMRGNRLIQPLDVPAGTVLREIRFTDNVVHEPEADTPGPLARALMEGHAASSR